MSFQAVSILAICLLGLPYIVLGIAAYSHFDGDGSKKMLAAGPWWPLYERYYNEKGKTLCLYGKVILVLSIPICIASFIYS